MEPRTERFEGSFETLDRVLLACVVEALVIDSSNTEHDAQVSTLGQKDHLTPGAKEIDVIVQRGRLFPRFDDLVDAHHERTSTRGIDCLAASYRALYFSDFARMRRRAGSLPVTQHPKANPPAKRSNPATRLLNRLKAPTAAAQTKKNSVRSTPRYVRGLCWLL